jgi:hypothetical protein
MFFKVVFISCLAFSLLGATTTFAEDDGHDDPEGGGNNPAVNGPKSAYDNFSKGVNESTDAFNQSLANNRVPEANNDILNKGSGFNGADNSSSPGDGSSPDGSSSGDGSGDGSGKLSPVESLIKAVGKDTDPLVQRIREIGEMEKANKSPPVYKEPAGPNVITQLEGFHSKRPGGGMDPVAFSMNAEKIRPIDEPPAVQNGPNALPNGAYNTPMNYK